MESESSSTGPRAAILSHGTGSTADFLERAFTPHDLGVDVVIALDDRTGDPRQMMAAIDEAALSCRTSGRQVAVVGGVSLGAHATALWAANPASAVDPRTVTLLLALPAWTGPPTSIASSTEGAAKEIGTLGITGAINRLLSESPDDWVTHELARAWPQYTLEELQSCLLRSAGSAGPTAEQLRSLAIPVAVIALADDPLHPLDVAAEWHRLIARSAIEVLPRDLNGSEVSAFGRAAQRTLRAAAQVNESQ